jgi:hypothetical protein
VTRSQHGKILAEAAAQGESTYGAPRGQTVERNK